MKKLFILFLGLSLIGCTSNENEAPTIDPQQIESESVKVVGMGAVCNEEAGLLCNPGLQCQINAKDPTMGGTCVDSVVNKEINCPDVQKPVCGLKNNNKNGYLNECEARRHGAKVLYDGFCKKDETVQNSCTGKVLGFEGCADVFTAVEFNGSECVIKTVQGCDVEIPFETIEACEQSCLGRNSQSSNEKITKVENNLLKECPDQKIINKMPMAIGDSSDITARPTPEYFIFKGARLEIADFDADFLKENCTIPELIVQ